MAARRLIYTDNNGTDQVLVVGEADASNPPGGSPAADAQEDHSTWIQNTNGFNKYKMWTQATLFDQLPLTASEFNTSEPQIFVEEWDGSSWNKIFRGYLESKGSTKSDGKFAFTLYDHSKYTGQQKTTVNNVSGTIDTILENILPPNYDVEVPGDVTIPSLSNYNLNGQRQIGYRDVTEKFGWTLRFTSRTNGAGNWVVRLEPRGYGGTVDSLAGKSSIQDNPSYSIATIKEWEKGKTGDIINSVETLGNDANGNKVVGTATNSTSISDYGEKFKRVTVDFTLPDQATADEVASTYLQPSPVSGGRVKVQNGYDGSILNDSFQVTDSNRGIDGVFTATKQKNYYPEGSTEIDFTFEKKAERKARESENLRSERNEVVTGGQQDVGNQSFTGDTGSAPSDTGKTGGVNDNASDTGTSGGVNDNASDTGVNGDVNSDPSDTGVNGDVDQDPSDTGKTGGVTGGGGASEEAATSINGGTGQYATDGNWNTLENIAMSSNQLSGAFVIIDNKHRPSGTPSGGGDTAGGRVHFQVADDTFIHPQTGFSTGLVTDGTYYARADAGSWMYNNKSIVIYVPRDVSNETLEVKAAFYDDFGGYSQVDFGYRVTVVEIAAHDHPDNIDTEDFDHPHGDTFDTFDNNHPHGDNFDTFDNLHPHGDDIDTVDNPHPHGDDIDTVDNQHGGTGDPTGQHGTSGSTDSKNIEVDNIEKEDR